MLKERLVKLRTDEGLSQYELAKVLGLSRGQISNYELGTRQPDYETLVKLADFFNVSTDYLLGRTNDPSPHPQIETIAAHRTDDPMDELPPEARRSLEEFIDFVYKKYGKKEGE